ncbi:flavodoxin family protein [Methanohalophilus halophilus]|uniref:Flavodoxin family protein n=1 Tax=Methanohalophilus halophilus TaxID=2177 RepID=A0A1L3Q131_9EURY|nr:flavodoxin family protein [Methanohalophilus halophilus]APH38577.1 iron-sulfur protein [Methanohalophilus halophilus]RNI08427.1 flavodoxin family protein [Methanohalophilus halophilus]SDW15364.1 Multimeric flavodoxin WrbA [Methanohalophilus halophilus]
MKVVGFVGSPRKDGNTDVLVQQVLDGASEAGADVRKFNINEMDFTGCQACGYCKAHERCKLEDDMEKALDAIIDADGIVFGSPIYFGQFTGQARSFIDRFYSLINPDFSPRINAGKKLVLVGSQGFPEKDQYKPVFDEFGGLMNQFFGMENKNTLLAAGYYEPGAVKNNTELMDEAKTTGKALLE